MSEIAIGVIVAEEQVERVVEKPDWAALRHYADGLTDGACLYGAGGCGLYTYEEILEEYRLEPWADKALIMLDEWDERRMKEIRDANRSVEDALRDDFQKKSQ